MKRNPNSIPAFLLALVLAVSLAHARRGRRVRDYPG